MDRSEDQSHVNTWHKPTLPQGSETEGSRQLKYATQHKSAPPREDHPKRVI